MSAPRFWDRFEDPRAREAAPMIRLLLSPLSMLYGAVAEARQQRADPWRPDIPVICVGNLTVGGSGKTPIVHALRERLSARGLRTATLSRGHGGDMKGPVRVLPDTHEVSDVGDEPLMLAEDGESWIARDRAEGARAMQAAGVEAIVMDDGFQNTSIVKTRSLLVFDGEAGVGNGQLLPAGPLRERIGNGLERADAICVMRPPLRDPALARTLHQSGLPIISAAPSPKGPPPPGPLTAFAGIGRPSKFFDLLAHEGGELAETVPFPDHHRYTPGDERFLLALAEERGAQLVTTEKDAVRLPRVVRRAAAIYRVRAEFEDEGAVEAFLDEAVGVTG